MGRGTFTIIVVAILAVIAGSFIGGRLSGQEVLVIAGLFLLWAVGVSIVRGLLRIRRRLLPPPPGGDE